MSEFNTQMKNFSKKKGLIYRGLTESQYEHYQKTGEIQLDSRSRTERHEKKMAFHQNPEIAAIDAGKNGRVLAFNERSIKLGQLGDFGYNIALSKGHTSFGGSSMTSVTPGPLSIKDVGGFHVSADDHERLINKFYNNGSMPILEGAQPGQQPKAGDIVRSRGNAYKLGFIEPTSGGPDPRHYGEWFAEPTEKGYGGRMYFDPERIKPQAELDNISAKLKPPTILPPQPKLPTSAPPGKVPEKAAELPKKAAEVPETPKVDPKPVPKPPESAPKVIDPPADPPKAATKIPEKAAEVPKKAAEVPKKAAEVPKKAAEVPKHPASAPPQTPTKEVVLGIPEEHRNMLSEPKPRKTTSKTSGVGGKLEGLMGKYDKLSGTNRLLIGGSFGAAAGLFTTLTNDKEDGVLGTIKNVAIGAAIDIATDKISEDFLGGDRLSAVKGGLNLDKIKSRFPQAKANLFKNGKGVGLAAGAAAGLVFGDKEGMLGSAWDGVVYGTAGYGVAALIEQMRIDKELVESGKIPDPLDPNKRGTVQTRIDNVTPAQVSGSIDELETKLSMEGGKTHATVNDMSTQEIKAKAIDAKESTTRAVKKFGHARTVGVIGVALFGAGVVADISNDAAQKRRVERETMRQERKLEQKQRDEDKAMRKMFGYDYMDYGNIVGELWNNRTGHHKMGNAKFQ